MKRQTKMPGKGWAREFHEAGANARVPGTG